VNPEDVGAGAAIGAALPPAAKIAGMAGKALAPSVSEEVAALYKKAKDVYKIDIPADRIANNKPLNALAASLNYVPFSGRAGTEEKMGSQLSQAVSRTFGQDSDNVLSALRKAQIALGDKFEMTLKGNMVKADDQLVNDLSANLDFAHRTLGDNESRIIGKQVDQILGKVQANGEIDGRAAYNIKRELDQIGGRNATESYAAREVKKSLMSALNRSLGPEEATAFAKVRQQYGNMLDVEGLVQRGAKDGVSVAKLANLHGVSDPELNDLANIAAQFIRPRESAHGAMQRVGLGTVGISAGHTFPAAAPILGGGVALARGTNMALNSQTLKNLMLGQSQLPENARRLGGNPALRSLLYLQSNRANP
jgi:hypothetical protein